MNIIINSMLETIPVVLDFDDLIDFSDDDKLLHFCELNKEARIERIKEGKIEIMFPVGGEAGIREATLTYYFTEWSKQTKIGII